MSNGSPGRYLQRMPVDRSTSSLQPMNYKSRKSFTATDTTATTRTRLLSVLLWSHWLLLIICVMVAIGFSPVIGIHRFPVLYEFMYSSLRWTFLRAEITGMIALFIAVLWLITGRHRFEISRGLALSTGDRWFLIFCWSVYALSWLLIMKIVIEGLHGI